MTPVRSALRQSGHSHLAFDHAVLTLRQGPGIRPVAHEYGIAGLKYATRLLFGIVQHTLGTDVLHPACRHRDRLDGLRIIDGYFALVIDYRATIVARDPFQSVAGQTLVSPPPARPKPHILSLPAARSPS